ncbi:hypothetical protein DSECCO2_661300 [anaerobic digester metagenome]
MAVGVVAGDPLLQPDDVAGAEVSLQVGLDLLPGEVRVPVGVQEARLRRDHRAAPVHLDRTPLEDETGGEDGDLHLAVHGERDPGILHKFRVLLPPGVERPVHHREVPGLSVDQKRRSVVPEPDVGVIGEMEPDSSRIDALLFEHRLHPDMHLLVGDEQVDGLRPPERRDDLDVDPLHRRKVGKRLAVVGPGEPDGIVRLPLRRHTVAGYRRGSARREPPGERPVGLRPPVPEESPPLPDGLVSREVDLDDEDFLTGLARPGEDVPERIGDKRTPEEPEIPLVTHTVDGGDVDAVCDRVAALHRLPRLAPVALGRLFARDPANGGRVEDELRAHERNRPRGFREPLVVADEHGDPAVPGIVDPVAVPGQKIDLLVEERIVGDVHLPVGREQPSIGVDHHGGVVVLAGYSPLVDRNDDHDTVLPGKRRERFGRRPGDRLGVAGSIRILVLREVGGPVEFLQAENPRTFRDRRFRHTEGAFQVAAGILAHRRLDEADRLRAHLHHLSVSVGRSSVL